MVYRSTRKGQRAAFFGQCVGEDVDAIKGALSSRAARLKALCDREARDSFNKQATLAKAKLGGALDKAKALGDLEALGKRAEMARSEIGEAYDRVKVRCEGNEALELARCKLERASDRAKQLQGILLTSQGAVDKTALIGAMKEQVAQSIQSAKSSSRVVAGKLSDGRQRVERALQKLHPKSRIPVGTDVEVTATFKSYNTTVACGTQGTVLSVDVFGHALIRFGARDVWVHQSQFENLRASAASDCGSDSAEFMADEEIRELCQRYGSALYEATLSEASVLKAGPRSNASTASSVSSDPGAEDGEHGEDQLQPSDDSELSSDPETRVVPHAWQYKPSTATWLMPAPVS